MNDRSKDPRTVLEKAAAQGKSIRQVIDEEHPELSDADRVLLAKTVVAWSIWEMVAQGVTPEAIRGALKP